MTCRAWFRPDKRQRHQQNPTTVVEVASQVADRAQREEATMRERWQIERDRLIAEIAVNEEHTRKRNELREELDDLRTARDLKAMYEA